MRHEFFEEQIYGKEWYAYDASGDRVLRRSTTSSGTSITTYALGLEEHLYGATGINTGNTFYYTLGGRLIGALTGITTLIPQFFLTDALGSVLATFSATAGSAAVLGNQVYGPYGNQRYTQGSMGTAKGYTGQYADATGLDYYNARYYDSVVGRFLSADTVQGNEQGMDPYAYVGGNPETMNDPTGNGACAWCNGADSGVGATIFAAKHGTPVPASYSPTPTRSVPTSGGSSPHRSSSVSAGHGKPQIKKATSTVCNGACGRRDKTLILNKITNIEEGRKVLIATTVGDGLALVADGIAAALDAAASSWTGFGFEVVSVLARAAALTGDLGKLGVFSIPSQISDLLQGLKIIANIVDTVEGIINLVNPVASIAKQAASFATQIVKPAVQAGILQLVASAASTGASTGYQKFVDAAYYDSLRAQINGYTDQQAYNACVHQYLANDPGQC